MQIQCINLLNDNLLNDINCKTMLFGSVAATGFGDRAGDRTVHVSHLSTIWCHDLLNLLLCMNVYGLLRIKYFLFLCIKNWSQKSADALGIYHSILAIACYFSYFSLAPVDAHQATLQATSTWSPSVMLCLTINKNCHWCMLCSVTRTCCYSPRMQ